MREIVADEPRTALVIAIGRAFHQSGMPSDQLEAVMHRTAAALDLELQVTALPTSITAAAGPANAQRVVLLRLEPGAIDLRRLALLNILYDRILAGAISTRQALTDVGRIVAATRAIAPVRTLAAYCALSVGVSIVLGGHLDEGIVSATIGLAVGATSIAARYADTIDRLFEVLAAFLATVIVSMYAGHLSPLAVYVPLVAGVVAVVPGWQLTAALHELAYRNLVAGTARLGSVFMTLISLGCGFALGIAVVGPGALHVSRIAYAPVPWYALVAAVLGIAIGIGVLQHTRPIDVPWLLASCGTAEIAYRIFANSPAYQVATFGAAVTVGILANALARFARVPQAVLLIPGVIIIVPGALSYESILFILQSDAADAGAIALNAVIGAVEIVAGLLLSQLVVAPQRRRA